MISNQAVGSLTFIILAWVGLSVSAAEQTASELYGRGVHAYFANQHDKAAALLSEAIEKNDADPRLYYFRGLALASKYGLDAGAVDLARGAELEAEPEDERLYGINQALQRVQGPLRLKLEDFRSAARAAAAERQKKQNQIKYEALKRREDVVLFRPKRPMKKIELDLPSVELTGKDPFASGAAFSGGEEVVLETPKLEQPEESETADSGAPAKQEPARDPFATPEPQSEDPFSTPTPFGETAPAAKTPQSEPSAEANPFGEEMGPVAPDDPLFDESVKPELPAGMNVGGSLLDLLGKTLSGKPTESSNRDPFAKSDSTPPASKPPPTDGSDANRFDEPGSAEADSEGPQTDPEENPFR